MCRSVVACCAICTDCRVLRLVSALLKMVERYRCPTPYETRHVADAINDEIGNKTRPSSLVYRNQTRPRASNPKMWLGRLFLGSIREPFEPCSASFSTHPPVTPISRCSSPYPWKKYMAFVHHPHDIRYKVIRLLNICSPPEQSLILEIPKRHIVFPRNKTQSTQLPRNSSISIDKR